MFDYLTSFVNKNFDFFLNFTQKSQPLCFWRFFQNSIKKSPSRQGPSDGETGGGQPFTSSDTGPGGGGGGGSRFGNIGSILGGLGGGAALNGIMNRFRNRGGGGGGAGGGLPPQQGRSMVLTQ